MTKSTCFLGQSDERCVGASCTVAYPLPDLRPHLAPRSYPSRATKEIKGAVVYETARET